tara:strand:+ start:48 stop:215 length:168 start_codon:yes stop_codon:yes gene_type:complete
MIENFLKFFEYIINIINKYCINDDENDNECLINYEITKENLFDNDEDDSYFLGEL